MPSVQPPTCGEVHHDPGFQRTRIVLMVRGNENGRDVAHYQGHIDKFGVDIGYTAGGVMVWGVIAPTDGVLPGGFKVRRRAADRK